MKETRAINPTTCSNCGERIKIGNTYYRSEVVRGTPEPRALCPACYEKRERLIKQGEVKE